MIYFAEPHKPWQRGTNENTNDLLRFFFPKGFDFRTITQETVDYIVNLINNVLENVWLEISGEGLKTDSVALLTFVPVTAKL